MKNEVEFVTRVLRRPDGTKSFETYRPVRDGEKGTLLFGAWPDFIEMKLVDEGTYGEKEKTENTESRCKEFAG
jgi:hypothetical protein